MLSAVQFLRLADRLSALPADVRRTLEALAAGDTAAAAAAAGGKGTDTWWGAEFALDQLRAHGIEPVRPGRSAPPRTAPLFAD